MGTFAAFFTKFFDTSEMLCSLKFESFKGCPYNAFTPCGIAVLTSASSVMAITALIVAA